LSAVHLSAVILNAVIEHHGPWAPVPVCRWGAGSAADCASELLSGSALALVAGAVARAGISGWFRPLVRTQDGDHGDDEQDHAEPDREHPSASVLQPDGREIGRASCRER